MKITTDTLKFYSAPEHLISFFEEKYKGSATIKEVLEEEETDLEFLFFLTLFFNFSKEEKELYNKKCKIDKDSSNVLESFDIRFSKNVVLSKAVEDSFNIEKSEGVKKSSYIYNSKEVEKSNNVCDSNNIKSSTNIVESLNVSNSNDVFSSYLIDQSEIISYSSNIKKCEYIYKSDNLEDSYFCGFCENTKHCLFCLGLKDKEYMIFNQEVSPSDFYWWKEELFFSLNGERKDFIQIHPFEPLKEERFIYSSRLDAIFEGLSQNFYGWVSNLPNYSEEVFLGLFFRNNEEFEK